MCTDRPPVEEAVSLRVKTTLIFFPSACNTFENNMLVYFDSKDVFIGVATMLLFCSVKK